LLPVTRMDQDLLTTEQRYLLRKLELDAQAMSRPELISALCAAWEARFAQKQHFIYGTREAGMMLRLEERQPSQLPESEEDLCGLFGHAPTDEEVHAYLKEQWETATMELDMDEIVQTPDDDWERP
jgi:hypothetical protein